MEPFSRGKESALAWTKRPWRPRDRKSTRLNSSHQIISYAVFCLKKKRLVPCRHVAALCGNQGTAAPWDGTEPPGHVPAKRIPQRQQRSPPTLAPPSSSPPHPRLL